LAQMYFYYSAMNAGKSTTLLQSSFNYQERGMTPVIFTAAIDDRYGIGKVSSRIGLEAEAHLFQAETNLFDVIKSLNEDENKYLLSWADKLVELKTICHCGRKANMVIRTDEHGVAIGGNDKYVSVCRMHYKEALGK